jgi:hypothetical protein
MTFCLFSFSNEIQGVQIWDTSVITAGAMLLPGARYA